ncbi:MAG: dienelactone hydrolase family protein, partial [Candidatus Brocadiia bacterium]|nr:dienelactone hydrolase family protein [Candidatus Brocadiia bacterium]
MSDFSVQETLQRRMREALARREAWPTDPEAIGARQRDTRTALLECLGARPADVLDPEARTVAELPLACTGAVQERLVYRTEEDVRVPAHLYRPSPPPSGKLPGVLLLQGWDLDKHTFPEFKTRLAAAGYVVLFPDNRFSGERRRLLNGDQEQMNLVPVAGLFGFTFMGMNTWDNQRALDVLAARPEVDADRLAVVGLCWGGMQSWTLAALDGRVKAACPVCAVSTYEALVEEYITWTPGHGCLGTYIPDWARHGDTQDIIACIAPRPLLIQNNVNDTWFPISGYDRVVREVGDVYRALGAAESFAHEARVAVHDITP